MRARLLILIVLLALIAGFAALNWATFTTPTSLSLGFASVEAPLGMVMLAILAGVVLLFVAYMAFWQGRLLVEARRHSKELQAQRTLADQAEASRFTELRGALAEAVDRLMARGDENRDALRTAMREDANSLAAMIAELDDRASRGADKP